MQRVQSLLPNPLRAGTNAFDCSKRATMSRSAPSGIAKAACGSRPGSVRRCASESAYRCESDGAALRRSHRRRERCRRIDTSPRAARWPCHGARTQAGPPDAAGGHRRLEPGGRNYPVRQRRSRRLGAGARFAAGAFPGSNPEAPCRLPPVLPAAAACPALRPKKVPSPSCRPLLPQLCALRQEVVRPAAKRPGTITPAGVRTCPSARVINPPNVKL